MNTILGLYGFDLFNGDSADPAFLHGTFALFVIVLALHATINIGGSHLVARINGVSVWWHVAGVAVILAVLIVVPTSTQSPTSSSPSASTTRASAAAAPARHVLVLRPAARASC